MQASVDYIFWERIHFVRQRDPCVLQMKSLKRKVMRKKKIPMESIEQKFQVYSLTYKRLQIVVIRSPYS